MARNATDPVWVCNPMYPERGSDVGARPRPGSGLENVEVSTPFSRTAYESPLTAIS